VPKIRSDISLTHSLTLISLSLLIFPGTILANEEVIGGVSERGGHPVTKIPLRQWLLKITDYANELERDLQGLQWPEGTMSAQRSWIGKSEGAKVRFPIVSPDRNLSSQHLEVFTTRVDTLLGVTYVVIAPEHGLLSKLTTDTQRQAVENYLEAVSSRSDTDRMAESKTGVFLGSYVRHPLTEELIPIWVGDYVLGHYGTGAVMAVPAHDQRDYQFALLHHLPIKTVIQPSNEDQGASSSPSSLPYLLEGILIGSHGFDHLTGISSQEGKERILSFLKDRQLGEKSVSYKLRDWVFSRQRYWGEPIPIYFPVEIDEGNDPRTGHPHQIRYDQPIPVPLEELPLRLPDLIDFRPGDNPDPQGCLARVLDWRYFQKNGKWYARETNTMPQWAGSCWYYLRFADPKNSHEFISSQAIKDWLPVDIYVGGQEHAVLHLLYARFWHKALYNSSYLLDHPEPFTRVIHQGLILGSDGEKMSKSKGNVVNPDDIVQEYGADVLRLYEMFMGPLEAAKPWQTGQLQGVVRFRERVYNLVANYVQANPPPRGEGGEGDGHGDDDLTKVNSQLIREMHRTIKRVTNDIETLSFNTAISSLMIYLNTLQSENQRRGSAPLPRVTIETLVLLLSPIAPHVSEECWELLGNKSSLAYFPWPKYSSELCELSADELLTMAIQVNGKLRTTIQIEKDSNQFSVEQIALKCELVKKHLEGKVIQKTIYVPGKILNFVLRK
jgi:leucyl-tRNA synthetase